MNKTALLIIDAQVVMFSGSLPLYKGEEIIKNICYLIDKARKSGVPIIYIQHTEADDKAMAIGKPLWQIYSAFKPKEEDIILLKYTPDSFYKTDLNKKLNEMGIKKLVIAGMQTEFCVDTSTRRAFSLGYDVTLVSDSHSTFDSHIIPAEKIIEHHNFIINAWFGEIKKAAEIIFK